MLDGRKRMSRIKVHPPRRPKLSKDGALTFMSPSGCGLAGLAKVLTPSCPCRDILLDMVPIDFRVQSVAVTKGKVSFTTNRLGGLEPAVGSDSWIAARLDVDTGELRVEPKRTRLPDAETLLAPLRDALDGELLDDFARLWRRLKGQPAVSDEPLRDPDFGVWEPGQTLAFGQVLKELRADGYPVGERIYEVVDLCCPDPECDCREVTVAFVDPADGSDAGAATVDLKKGDVSFSHETDDEALVPGLWERYVFRHRGIPLLFERRERMKEFGETLFERLEQQRRADVASRAVAGRAKVKIGRNEPCPCGSGKKYKKCCLPRVAP